VRAEARFDSPDRLYAAGRTESCWRNHWATLPRDFSRRAVDSVRNDSKETAALWQVNASLREAEFGNAATAKQGVAAALALARTGETARAKAMVEELEKNYVSARATYNDFFTLWRDADLDIPILIAAKAEYAKLK
jgi:hypothetical protein